MDNLYTVKLPDCGPLSIMARPRGGAWLPDAVAAWKGAGVQVVVSLLTGSELRELDLMDEECLCVQQGMPFVPFPIPDRQTPPNTAAAVQLIETIAGWLGEGKHVAIHCRVGIGHSGMIASCALIALGASPQGALDMLTKARGWAVPDTAEQRAWVLSFPTVRQQQAHYHQ